MDSAVFNILADINYYISDSASRTLETPINPFSNPILFIDEFIPTSQMSSRHKADVYLGFTLSGVKKEAHFKSPRMLLRNISSGATTLSHLDDLKYYVRRGIILDTEFNPMMATSTFNGEPCLYINPSLCKDNSKLSKYIIKHVMPNFNEVSSRPIILTGCIGKKPSRQAINEGGDISTFINTEMVKHLDRVSFILL